MTHLHCTALTRATRRGFLKAHATAAALWIFATAIACPLLAETAATPPTAAPVAWVPSDAPNSPMGEAKGIYPGRVVWARNVRATPWAGDILHGHWWEEGTGVVRAEVETMVSSSLQALTGTTTDGASWEKLFRSFNQTHGRGDTAYREGEIVAIKTNCNNAYEGYGDRDNQVDAVPQTLLCMLRQLVVNAGVPQENIFVYEAARVIPDRVYEPCHREFPRVIWVDSQGDGKNGREPVEWHKEAFQYSNPKSGCGNSIPERVWKATYLINMALLKGHLVTGVTLTGKNHYGSIDGRDHREWLNAWKHGMGRYNPLVDLVGTRQFGGKTLLFMIDGLFGTRDVNDCITPECASWKNLFGGEWSASLFMSQDPVAIDSVGLDFLRCEWGDHLASSKAFGRNLNADNYLHEAALAGHAPSGTEYQPDGKVLGSLGVHEHWNDWHHKQYSRNLGPNGTGIELVPVSPTLLNDENGGTFDRTAKEKH